MVQAHDAVPPLPAEEAGEAVAGPRRDARGPGWARILLALLPPLLAAGLQLLFWDKIQPFIWFLFYPAVFLSSWIGGLRGAVPATLLAAFLAVFCFVPPRFAFPKESGRFHYSVAVFLLMGGLFGQFHQRLARARREALDALKATRRAHRELEALYAKAQELDELKTRFFSNVSHELRTPLTLILGPLEQRLGDPALEPALREDLARMARNARLLQGQVNDLLDVAKLEAGRMAFQPRPTDLAALLRLECARFESLARERGLDYSLAAAGPLPASLDREKFRRVLANLLSNAFKFTPAPGRIRVEAAAEGAQLRLEVRDSGPGIPAAHRETVFDRFQQLDSGADRGHGGTGLGLAIVKEFVLLHGGTVAVETAPEGGACFRVRLPAGTGTVGPDPALDLLAEPVVPELLAGPAPAARAEAPAGAPVVLVVEDNPDMNAFLAGLLGRQYRVRPFLSAREALASALAEPPNLVLSDVMMAGMSGDQLVAALREQPSLDAVPIVLLTARADDALRVRMLRGGVADYICKPFDPEELLARVGGLLTARRRQQDLLATQEERFQATFEQAAVGIALFTREGAWIAVNQRLCDLLGYTREELLGLPLADLTHPGDLDRTRAFAEELVQGTRSTYSVEKRYLRKDGSPVWVEVTASRVVDRPNQPGYFTAIVQDIEARKQAERVVQESEERFRQVSETADEWIWEVDAEGLYTYASPAVERILGFTESEVVGLLHFYDLFEPGTREHLKALALSAFARREPLRNLPNTNLHRDGREILLETTALPILGPAGELLGYRGVDRDVTERARAAEVLRESEERFQAIFLAAPLAILIIRPEDGRIIDANPAFSALFGYDAGELRGRTSLELGLWHDLEARVAILAQLERDRFLRDAEARFVGRSGEAMTLLLSAVAIRLGEQDIRLAMFQDLRTRTRAEEERRTLEHELSHLQRMESIGRLAGGVSHDMNNVLSAIMAVASLVKIRQKDNPEVVKNAETILQAGLRGRDLVKGLMDFARKDLQHAAPVDLNLLVRQEADLLERTTFKKVEIQVSLAEALPEILGEPSALSNVLMNLCVNACDAMPRGGRLTLSTRRLADGGAELAVEDTGEGMPPEVVARAMEPFFTTKAAGKGTGLGLSIVYGTVKAHGGSVDIHSEPGRGTRVCLRFPPLAQRADAGAAGGPQEFVEVPGLRLLLVDDDELVRASLPPMLESLGHQVQVASGGLDALRRLNAGLVADVVVLDMNMPGLDGLETLGRLRISHPDLAVVVASGFLDPETRERLAGFPNLRVLGKPFSAQELQAALRDLAG